MKRTEFLVILFTMICVQFTFADTEVTPYFYLTGDWKVIHPGGDGFSGSPTEQYGIEPFAKVVRNDGKYFGYLFNYGPGAMTGQGSPMEGDFEFYPEWAEFGWAHLMEADFRSILEKFGSDLRRQFFWEEKSGALNATGYAYFNNSDYGFVSLMIIPDVAWYLAAIIFCNLDSFDENINEMKESLGMEIIEYSEW